MKRTFLFAALVALLASCGGSEQNQELAVGSKDLSIKKDQAIYGLLGPVKEVKGDEGQVLVFNEDGNLTESYVESTRYKGRTRIDEADFMQTVYKFDELGRVVSVSSPEYNATYTYSENAYYPDRLEETIMADYDEEPVALVHEYQYFAKKFDKYGNWLVRQDGEKKETRKITYYEPEKKDSADEDGGVTGDGADAARKVVEKRLKAMVKKDVKAYMATYSPEMLTELKAAGLTEDKVKKTLEDPDEHVKSYKITGVEQQQDGWIVNTDLTLDDNSVEQCAFLCGKEGGKFYIFWEVRR